MTQSRDSLPLDLVRSLDILALERTDEYTFIPVTHPPAWAARMLAVIDPREPLTLSAAFPFLDHFLSDAEAFWRDGTGQYTYSRPFTATTGAEEILLRACALIIGPRSVLVLERLRGEADIRPLLQTARENRLVQEHLQKQVDGAQAPVAALATLTQQLTATELTPAQRDIAARIGRELDRLQRALRPR